MSLQSNFSRVTADANGVKAKRLDGTLWAWGNDGGGSLGQGTNGVSKSSPVQVGLLTDWNIISAAQDNPSSVKADGTLWTWGQASFGRLGLGDLFQRSSPVQIGSDTDWLTVSEGEMSHTLALKTDGTLWAWGGNGVGQLGDGSTLRKLSPVQIGTDTDWVLISAASNYSHAIKSDGTLWGWGANGNGALGLGDTFDRSSPSKVGSETDWSYITAAAHSLALKTDCTLWAWGDNITGALGQGDFGFGTERSEPTQVGLDDDWDSIAVAYGLRPASAAVRKDGTLWTWGGNDHGQLGQSSMDTHTTSPIQVGSLTDWLGNPNTYGNNADGGESFFVFLKRDSSLWAWGQNDIGQLGQGDTVKRSSPVQIGVLCEFEVTDDGKNKQDHEAENLFLDLKFEFSEQDHEAEGFEIIQHLLPTDGGSNEQDHETETPLVRFLVWLNVIDLYHHVLK